MSYKKDKPTTTLVFNPPGPDEPGFFRRAIEVQAAMDRIDNGGGLAAWQDLISYLAQYVEGPKEDVTALLMDASQTQVKQMVGAITGGLPLDPFGLNGNEKSSEPSKASRTQAE